MKQQWGDVRQATAILSKNAGRTIDASYVRSLVRAGHIAMRKKDGRTNEYNLDQCRGYVVKRKGQPSADEQPAKEEDEHQALDLVG